MSKQNSLLTLVVVVGLLAVGFLQESAAQQGSVSSKYDLTLYGYVKLDAAYDTQKTAAGNLMFFVLPEGDGGKEDEFNMTANETRLGMRLRVPDLNGARVNGVLEGDFYGFGGQQNSPNLRLRLAYVDIERGNWALRAGQDWETFITAIPRIVNFSYLADAGALGLRRPQLRLTKTTPLGEHAQLIAKLAAARTIGQDIDGGGQDDGAAAGYPTVQANLALQTRGAAGRRMVIGVSGHAGTETVSAYTDASNPDEPVVVDEKDYDTWSVIGSVNLPLAAKLMLQGAIWQGENLDNYFGAIGQGINKQRQTGIGAKGGWAQLVVDPSEKINVNLGYGLDNPDRDDLNAGNRSQNEIWFGNLFYRLNEALTLAAEYSHLTTSYLGGEDAVNNRVQGSVIFRF